MKMENTQWLTQTKTYSKALILYVVEYVLVTAWLVGISLYL